MKTQRLKSKTQDCKDTFSLVVFPSLSPWLTAQLSNITHFRDLLAPRMESE